MINFGQMTIWYSRQLWSKYWNQKSQNEGFFLLKVSEYFTEDIKKFQKEIKE